MSHLKSALLALALAPAFLTACDLGAFDDGPTEFLAEGQPHEGDPAVAGLIVNTPTGSTVCSGVLIAPRVVLTAAHCVEGATSIQVGFGTRLVGGRADAYFLDATEWVINPASESSSFKISQNVDSAVLRLARPAAVTPLGLNDDPAAIRPGTVVRTVGYGDSDPKSPMFGVKQEGTSELTSVDDTSYGMASAPGFAGAAGSPTFASIGGQEYVIGIDASAGNPALERGSVDSRVDAQLDFIDTYLELWR